MPSLRSLGVELFWKLAPYMPDSLRLKTHFYWVHKSWPDLARPQSFSEKLQWRKLHDRRPLLTTFADKVKVRDYVKQTVGERYLTDLYWVAEDPRTLRFEELPKKFVLKTNHGTRWNILVPDQTQANRDECVAQLAQWLQDRYPLERCEWGYHDVKPLAFAEEFLMTRAGIVPPDFKFFVFHGKARLIQVDLDRAVQHTRCLYDPDWNLLPVVLGYPSGRGIERPGNFAELMRVAEQLAGDIDFVRVDLYNVDGRIVFGELTNYPGGGLEEFTPPSFDRELGRWWTPTVR
jgi:hypothetical protein